MMSRLPQTLLRPIQALGTGFLDLVYPPQCEICGGKLSAPAHLICDGCLQAVPLRGYEIHDFSVHGEVGLDGAWCLLDFEPTIQTLIHLLKYSRRPNVVLRICNFWRAEIVALLEKESFDLVAPIPLHTRKARERGYNQVTKLARWLGENLGIVSDAKLLKRNRYTATQTQLNAAERFANVDGVFDVTRDVTGKHILLVDDVLTTGSTANSCALTLKNSGAAGVKLLTLATPSRGGA